MTTIEMRLAQRERPKGRPKMFHSWRHLTFLHWPVPAEELQRLLPPGLTVDTHEGVAYVGLVPFTMHSIRLSWAAAMRGLRESHETNVRTYVVDERGVPGVWFFSLDAANPLFVRIARAWYRLPYVLAEMKVEREGDGWRYESVRRWPASPGAASNVLVTGIGEETVVDPGSLEFFLVERYVLFSYSAGRLLSGRVFHKPYSVHKATCGYVQENLVKAAQIERPESEPHVLYSPGVDVEVFGLVGAGSRE